MPAQHFNGILIPDPAGSPLRPAEKAPLAPFRDTLQLSTLSNGHIKVIAQSDE
jgi:hypothetical protein